MSKRIKLTFSVIISSIVLVLAVCISLVSPINKAHAASSDEDIMKRALAGAMLMCYRNYSANFVTPFNTSERFFVDNVVKENGSYLMPTNVGNKLNNRTVNCREVFSGVRGSGIFDGTLMTGIIESFGKSTSNVLSSDLGYVASTGGTTSNKKCLHLNYKHYTSESTYDANLQTNDLCFPIGSDGKVDVSNPDNITQEGNIDKSRYGLELGYNQWYSCVAANINDGNGGTLNMDTRCLASPYGLTFDELTKQASAEASNGIMPHPSYIDELGYYPYGGENEITVGISNASDLTETVELNGDSAVVAMNWLSGQNNGFTDFTFGPNEWAYLYNSYINQLRDSGEIAIDTSCTSNKTDANVITMDRGQTWCKVDRAENVTQQFAGQDGSSNKLLKLMSFSQILEKMKNLDYSRVDAGIIGDNGNNDPGVSASELSNAACYDATAPLGWIVCPVIKTVGNATTYLYSKWIEPMLSIKASELFTQNGTNSSIYKGWSEFRNFSNILFAIVFVIVILAQITGIGISNYNIKKILPRLIMVVVLVNISFIICQLAVDVSNILGSTLKNMFEGLTVSQYDGMDAAATFLNALGLLTVTAGVGTGLAVLGTGVIVAELQYFAIPILIGILGCAISVLFFFAVLGARQAGIVVLVVLAPVAIVCYALPNTKSLFDKWKKLFIALLLVYPICGLLMGAGTYVSSLLLSVDANQNLEPINGIVAMLISVVPFFMVPSLVRSSMAAIGNLGAKIQGLGAGLRGGLTRTIKGSQAYQEGQNEKLRNLNIRRAQTRVGRYSKDPNAGGGLIGRARRALGRNDNLSEYQAARLGQAQSTIDKLTGDTGAAIEASWRNDGSADDIGDFVDEDGNLLDISSLKANDNSITARYIRATQELMKDPNNHGALERQKAAAAILASTAPGRTSLQNANAALANHVGTLDAGSADYSKATRILNRTANNLMRTNGSDIAKSGLLEEQLKEFMNSDAQYIGTDKNGQTLNERVLASSIDSLNTRAVAEMNKRDLAKYLGAARAGKLNASQIRALSDLAGKAMTDQHYKGSIKKDAMPGIQQLANLQYNQSSAVSGRDMSETIANTDAVQSSLANASSEELSRIRSSLGSMSDTERAQTLANLGETLTRAVSGEEGFTMSADNANQISKILQENHVDAAALGSQYGITDYQDKLDQLTGIKIQHPPRQTLTDRHANWRRATAADVQQVMGTARRGPHAHVPFAVDDWVEVDGGGRITKLDARRAKEAEMLETADLEAARAQQDDDFRAQQRRQNP